MKEPCAGRTTHAIFEISKSSSTVVDNQEESILRGVQTAWRCGQVHVRQSARVPSPGCEGLVSSGPELRKRYTLGGIHRWAVITKALSERILLEPDTIGALADKMGIAREAFESTIRRWNGMCEYGTDIHHKSGEGDYQRVMGDPRVTPNSYLGAVERAPCYASRISPGDVGRKKRL